MNSVTFVVNDKPPYKQTPADTQEKQNQSQRKQTCVNAAGEARKHFTGTIFTKKCVVQIRYHRAKGQSDSGNIVGGILDALQGIVYKNDSQVVEIHYLELPETKDRYQVTVTELF